jgi:hypothetical protein
MIEIDIGRLVLAHNALCTFGQTLTHMRDLNGTPSYIERDIKEMIGHFSAIREIAEAAEMPGSVLYANELCEEIALVERGPDGRFAIYPAALTRVSGSARRLQDILKAETRSKLYLFVGMKGATLWSPNESLFGAAVDTNFSSAVEDIEEAAKCLAVDRGTACVMHLMRATEVPLKALAGALNVGPQNDWGSYIRKIDEELGDRLKATGKRTADEAFYSHASMSFERVKRGWRNSTMHVDQTYTVERAQEIFDATKSFMRHLATRLKE